MVKVFLVDDHEVVRRGLIDLLSADPNLTSSARPVGGRPWPGSRRCAPTSPCSTYACPTATASNCAAICCRELPDLRCLMLTSFTSDEAMLDAILAGASGYVVKDIKGMELARPSRTSALGRSLLDNRAAAALMAKLRGAAARTRTHCPGLTDQERICSTCSARG